MKLLCFYTLLLLLFAMGCKKEKTCETFTNGYPSTLTRNIDSVKAKIEGNWEWVQDERNEIGQQSTQYLTPCTEGYTERLELKNDTARFFKNNKPDGVFKYAIVKLKVITGTSFPEDEYATIVYYRLSDGLRDSHVPLKISNKYLLMQFLYVSSVTDAGLWRRE
jgi:hypothetical protein